MNLLDRVRDAFAACPLVASVQSSEGSAVEHPETLGRLALASLSQGVRVLRLQGEANIRHIRSLDDAFTIGLIKRRYERSEVYITPTSAEVDALLDLGVEIIALDATDRIRPSGESLADLVKRIHAGGALAAADCDSDASVKLAVLAGADIICTTLRGYTEAAPYSSEPDLEFVRQAVRLAGKTPVLAEGRFSEPWQIRAALQAGATGVVVGGALNDPVKQTRNFVSALPNRGIPVGAFDIGGTWLRYGLFGPGGELLQAERIELPATAEQRLDWMRGQVRASDVRLVGVSSGGTLDPQTGQVTEATEIIPGHVGTVFPGELGEEVEVIALNDGLATAWAHAWLPEFSGKRVATLALGTGVGFGIVDRGRIWMGPNGEYPRLNDQPTSTGRSFESLLGGASLGREASAGDRATAKLALIEALRMIRTLFMPDHVVLCGGVGLSNWITETVPQDGWLVKTPYGADAGLYGAATLAWLPPF